MKRELFFPRSLRQLVLMAFLLVLLPLLVLAWQAWESLTALSDRAADTNRNTFTDVRRSEAMARTALELERNYRQYCVLEDTTLQHLYQTQYIHYGQMLNDHAGNLPEMTAFHALRTALPALKNLRCDGGNTASEVSAVLETFSETNIRLVEDTRKAVFERGLQLQREIAKRGQFFGWQALLLFLVSLALVLLCTGMIIGPIKRLERMIDRLGSGQEAGAAKIFRGPRELRLLGQRIVWLSERLTWLETQRHLFLRHLSHELKTPLASMREGTELLADGVVGPLTPDQKEVVTILNNSSRQLQTLIEQLLEYNRRLAETPLSLQPVSLETIVNDIVSTHALSTQARQMQTHITLQVTSCLAEPSLLRRVLDNLYSNAINYGAESGSIWLRSHEKAGKVWIEVANTGTPVAENEREMIFEPFFQGQQPRTGLIKGSGLGLSIARDCVRYMQGNLFLISDKEADVCFCIELPLK